MKKFLERAIIFTASCIIVKYISDNAYDQGYKAGLTDRQPATVDDPDNPPHKNRKGLFDLSKYSVIIDIHKKGE